MSTIKLRVWHKEKKIMYNPETNFPVVLSGLGFNVLHDDEELADEKNCVLMLGCNYVDKNGRDVFEGDLVYFKRRTARGFLPVVGVVARKDFTFNVVAHGISFQFDYADKEFEVLGNLFENTDAELATATENKLKHFTANTGKK